MSMATQRLTVATVGGQGGRIVSTLFSRWQGLLKAPDLAGDVSQAVGRFCELLRANCEILPILYFSQWIDRWLMGDMVPGPQAVRGDRVEVACLSATEAKAWAERCGSQFDEHRFLAARLREAADAWQPLAGPLVVVVMREVIGPSALDQEITSSLAKVPNWLEEINKL
jgi:hypothetical protein